MPRNAQPFPTTGNNNPPPTFVFEGSDSEPEISLDLDLDPPEPSKLFASSLPASSGGFLKKPPGDSNMADEGPSDMAPSAASPFNFQTQVISTGPVKSVRAQPNTTIIDCGFFEQMQQLTSFDLEHRTTSRAQVQA